MQIQIETQAQPFGILSILYHHDFDFDYIKNRVNYYNKLNKEIKLNKDDESLNNFKIKNFHRTYFFDTYQYTRFFEKRLKLKMLFGDITHSPDVPSIVKII